jgi:hypothetical protein
MACLHMQGRPVPESCPSSFYTTIEYVRKKKLPLIQTAPTAPASELCIHRAPNKHLGAIENT